MEEILGLNGFSCSPTNIRPPEVGIQRTYFNWKNSWRLMLAVCKMLMLLDEAIWKAITIVFLTLGKLVPVEQRPHVPV